MFKSVLMASTAAIALVGVAHASDLPSKAAPAAVHAMKKNPFDGFYIGVHGGYGTGTATTEFAGDAEGFGYGYFYESFSGSFDADQSGYLLGAQAGANFVGANGLFVGAEVSGSWANIVADQFGASGSIDSEGGYMAAVGSDIDALGIAKAKLGWASDTVAIYASAGVALAHENTRFDYVVGVGPFTLLSGSTERSHMRSGFTVGGGIDFALSNSTTLGVSYDYVRLAKFDDFYVDSETVYISSSSGFVTNAHVDSRLSNDLQIVKVNLNYDF